MRRYGRNRWGRHHRQDRWRRNLDTNRLLSFRRRNLDTNRLLSFRRRNLDTSRLLSFRRNTGRRRNVDIKRNPDPNGNPWGPSLYDPLSDKENKFKDESNYQGVITKLYRKNPYPRQKYRRNAEEGLFDSIYSRRRNPWSYRSRRHRRNYRRNPFWDTVKSTMGSLGRGAATAGKAAGRGLATAGKAAGRGVAAGARGTKKWYDEGGKQKMVSAGKKVARGTGKAMRLAGQGVGKASRYAGKKLQSLGEEEIAPVAGRSYYRYNPCEDCNCDPCACYRRRNPGWRFTGRRPLRHEREFSEMYYRRPTKPLRRRPIGRYGRNPLDRCNRCKKILTQEMFDLGKTMQGMDDRGFGGVPGAAYQAPFPQEGSECYTCKVSNEAERTLEYLDRRYDYRRNPTTAPPRAPRRYRRRNPGGLFPKEGLYSSIYSRRRNPGGLFPKGGLYSSIYSRRRNPRRYY